MWFMGVDMGTSGCKAVVFDEHWAIAAEAYREYPMSLPGEGLLELDAELVWQGIQAVIREANEKSAQPVAALAVSAIGDVIIPVDENGKSIRHSIVDFDPRGAEEIAQFAEAFGTERFFAINGMPPLYIGSLAKILYLKKHEPDVYARAQRWASYEDFIIHRLGLPPTASYSELSRTMLFDIRKKQWSDEILAAIPLDAARLPRAVPSGTVIGELGADMRKRLGFGAPVMVAAGGHDMVCAAVGVGLDENEPGTAVDIAGSIEGLVAAFPAANTHPVMLANKLPCYVGHTGYVTFSVNLTAGVIVRWYRDHIAQDEYLDCQRENRNFYEYMQRTARADEPGSLLLLPHFSGSGNPFFDARAQGVLYGLTLDTPREDIARAIVEGLSYDLTLHLEAFENAGIKLDTIRAVGGGARIDSQLQMKANITGLRVVKGAVAESSAMGAAAYAAVAMGQLANPADAYRRVKANETVFEPDAAAHAKFHKAFQKYRALAYAIAAFESETR